MTRARPVVLIAARQHVSDLDAIVEEVKAITGDVIVADASFSFGAALAGGLARAAEMGFTHAVVLDVSWHHPPAELPKFFDAIAGHADAIISGVRQDQAARLSIGRRFARWNADFWTWAETGRWVHDCTYGYRAYPLAPAAQVALKCDGFAADVELLVKSMWAGAKVVEVPLDPELTQGEPQAMPFLEVHGFAWLTWMLMFQRILLPAPLRATIHLRPFAEMPWWRRFRALAGDSIRQYRDEPALFAACISLGAFFGAAPLLGFQMILVAAASQALRLSRALMLVGAGIVCSPLTFPFIIYLSIATGRALRAGDFSGLPGLAELKPSMKVVGDYFLGGFVLATVTGVAAGVITYAGAVAAKALRARRRADRSLSPEGRGLG